MAAAKVETKLIGFEASPEIVERLDAIAMHKRCSRAEMMLTAIKDFLAVEEARLAIDKKRATARKAVTITPPSVSRTTQFKKTFRK